MLDRELSVKGWNWGTANFAGNSLAFEVGKTDAFEIPLASVQQCTPGKNEVALEFHAVSYQKVSPYISDIVIVELIIHFVL